MIERGVLLVGFGGVGRSRLSSYDALDLRLVGVVEPIPSREVAELQCPVYRDLSEVPSHLSYDIVEICSPAGLHHVHGSQLTGLAPRIVCEKPLSTEWNRPFWYEITSGSKVYPVHNYKHAGWWLQARRQLTGQGKLKGHIEFLRPNPSASVDDWRSLPSTVGGGIQWDMLWHPLYLLDDLENGWRVRSASRCPSHGQNCCYVEIETPGGSHVSIVLSWFGVHRSTRFRLQRGPRRIDLDSRRGLAGDTGSEFGASGTGKWHVKVLQSAQEAFDRSDSRELTQAGHVHNVVIEAIVGCERAIAAACPIENDRR